MTITTKRAQLEVTRSSVFIRVDGLGEAFIMRGMTTFSSWGEVKTARDRWVAKAA